MLHFDLFTFSDSSLQTTPLPTDSLAHALLLAATAVAAVFSGKSLTDVLSAHARESASTRASVQDLAYGALRRYGQGDAVLAALLSRPLPMPEVRALLLCAMYRLDTRPDAAHTVVDQAVEAAGQLVRGSFRGLVNGVLRNYLRQREVLLNGLTSEEARNWHPDWWLAKLRRAYYPDQWQQIVDAGNRQSPMALRVNRRKINRDAYLQKLKEAGIDATPLGVAGVLLTQPQPVDILPGFFDGLASVQDGGAQRAAELLGAQDGQRVLDACAAPGGKAAHLLELADIKLTALEVDARRARRIEDNLARLDLAAEVKVADCRDVSKWWDGVPFDCILADVPCSASGVVSRHPDSKWLRRETDIAGFARVQRQILEALWPTLAPGGKLLYATCSVFPEENSRQLSFAETRLQARKLVEEQWLPQADHDGFYYALLQKKAG